MLFFTCYLLVLSKKFCANEAIVAKVIATIVLMDLKKKEWVENFYNFAVFLNANTDNIVVWWEHR